MSRRSALTSWFASPPPTAAVEIGAGRVTAVGLSTMSGRTTVAGHASEKLPEGLVVPGLTTPNVTDPGRPGRCRPPCGRRNQRANATRGAGDPRRRRQGLAGSVEKLPGRQDDLGQLVRWQVRKAVPFGLEHAQVSWTTGVGDESGTELVVTIARGTSSPNTNRPARLPGCIPGSWTSRRST